MSDAALMDKLVSLAKRRGYIFQSSEIYGGLGSVWDYGPLGVELKKNLKERWWRSMVYGREDIEGIDAAILSRGLQIPWWTARSARTASARTTNESRASRADRTRSARCVGTGGRSPSPGCST